ncbi:TPA: nucleoside recognition protein [Candidatus Galligastranaerophilus gallistercoris]|nr:nucleoside recognition protein [Candidatus Galligastranaerophilus gallistercoris]
MNVIFILLILISLIFAVYSGRLDETVNAMFSASMRAVEVSISLIGVMALWLGFVKIAQKSGLIELFAKIISPLLRFIFNELPKDSPAFSNIALNISANALGLSNAATPFGIKAMKDLKKESNSKDKASNSMCIFLAMNTSGFQLVPSSVLAILVASGAKTRWKLFCPFFW